VNRSSPAFYLNRSAPKPMPRGLDPRGRPRWRKVASGNAYSWHEDRLHALASASHTANSSYIGRWTIPLTIGGRRTSISGGLWYHAPPSLVWFWPIGVVLLSLPALLRLRRVRLNAAVAMGLAAATLVAGVVGGTGRGLYGRPTVSVGQLIVFAIALLIGVVLAYGFLVREWRTIAAILIGGYGLWIGISLFGTLTHGFVLAVLPGWVERAAAVITLAGSVGLWLVVLASETGVLRTREA
jgi:hypothetical protein